MSVMNYRHILFLFALTFFSFFLFTGLLYAVPQVDTADITVSGSSGTGGAYIVGDTVVVEWDASNDAANYAPPASDNITGVDIDFSDFGGAAVAAEDDGVAPDAAAGDGVWTASYTIVAGAIDTTTARAEVTATNGDGTTGPVDNGSDLVCDNELPVA